MLRKLTYIVLHTYDVRKVKIRAQKPFLATTDFRYILPGAVGLPRGSNLYVWNPHIICGRTSMFNGH